MPDWSYHTIFKPILQKLPPAFSRELIHRGMSTISSFPPGVTFIEFLGHMASSKEISKNVLGVHFSTPVGLSGKIDPHLSGLQAFQHLGFGCIEVGPITMSNHSASTNDLSMNLETEQITTSRSTSISVQDAKKKLQSLKKREIPLLIKLDGSIEEITSIADDLRPYGDMFIVRSHILNDINDLYQLKSHLNWKPVILSIAVNELLDSNRLNDLRKYELDGIVLEEEISQESDEQHTLLLKGIKQIRTDLGINFPIITVGGIREPSDAIALLMAGATLVLLSFEYVFSGPGLPKRINEAYSSTIPREEVIVDGWRWYWLFGLCILLAGFLTLFFSMTRIVLPYDESFLRILRNEIIEFNPSVLYFMAHDRMTLAGTMISGGFIYMQLARYGIKTGQHWARRAVNIAGITGFRGILLFIGYGYFDWLHGVFWAILLPLFIMGYVKSKRAIHSPHSSNLFNHPYWKRGLFGQLCFVILGFSLVIGGIVISVIGTTSVFVPTDLTYLRLAPEAINEFNNRLIPVIAHDRAGFGSALLSVGLLVLMLALWGIRERERWVWWTFFFGALPAFLSGLVTHFVIGYTDFVHLLPAYIALLLYLIGVVLLAPYLLIKSVVD
jgi:dihydroorotate dehydrogenase